MTDYQIYRKLSPFLWKRLMYALLGLLLIIGVLALATYWGELYPDYRVQITALLAVAGIFIGWKIIRKGEKRYQMAQVAVITDIVRGNDIGKVSIGESMKKVNSTFKYSSVFGLLKNIARHKNFRKTGQYLTIAIASKLPYVGTCNMSWVFAHPEDNHLRGACHAVTNYYRNRGRFRKKIFKAFLKEIALVVLLFFVLFALGYVLFLVVAKYYVGLEDLLDKVEDFTDTIEMVYEWYFADGKGYKWAPLDVITLIALYLAWFIKVFSIRSYQMIGIIRDYLAVGDENPPDDALYDKLMLEWEKAKGKGKSKNEKADKAENDTETTAGTTVGTTEEAEKSLSHIADAILSEDDEENKRKEEKQIKKLEETIEKVAKKVAEEDGE